MLFYPSSHSIFRYPHILRQIFQSDFSAYFAGFKCAQDLVLRTSFLFNATTNPLKNEQIESMLMSVAFSIFRHDLYTALSAVEDF